MKVIIIDKQMTGRKNSVIFLLLLSILISTLWTDTNRIFLHATVKLS
jgi:hypothetical protein